MEATAIGKYVKGSPQKARLVVDLIRGKRVEEALSILRYSHKRAAKPIEKVLLSAVANAEEKSGGILVEELVVTEATIDLGPTKNRRRLRPAPQGRAFSQMRRQSHITIRVAEVEG